MAGRVVSRCAFAPLVLIALCRPAAAASMSLAWDSNPEPDIAGYVVHYGTSSGAYAGAVDVGKTTAYTIPDLVAGQRYYFAVSAYNTSGLAGDLSAEVSGLAPEGGTGGPQPSYYYLAEGATGPVFITDLALGNPNASPAPVRLQFLRPDGTSVVDTRTLPALSRTTIRVNDLAALQRTALSAIVESTQGAPLLVERSMFWGEGNYGGHSGTSVDVPRTRWYFGEGSQGFFDTYVLIANPNGTAAAVTVSFLPESGPPVQRTYAVAGTSRFTLFAGDVPELQGRSFGITVDSDQPVLAERAMYFGSARIWDAGHESAGVPGAATRWFHAEGATGTYFDTYILVSNPNALPASATLTFLLGSGETMTRSATIPANGRLTINVEDQDPRLASAAVSTVVTSDLPIISERSMYWPGTPASWGEAHNAFGTTTEATKWGIAEGRVGGTQSFETYILVANPSAAAADVSVTFLRENRAPVRKVYRVAPTSRFNIHVNGMVPELADEQFASVLESLNGVPIVVERAMYWSAAGEAWAGGSASVGSVLP
jgi:hypothetical protein